MPPETALPAQILLYIAGATAVVNVLVNGIRTSVQLPAIVAFLGACAFGFVFVVAFMIANSVTMTPPLWAAAVIAGVMVGGASAGSNAVHARAIPTEPSLEATPSPPAEPDPLSFPGKLSPEALNQVAIELEARLREQRAAPSDPLISQDPHWLPQERH